MTVIVDQPPVSQQKFDIQGLFNEKLKDSQLIKAPIPDCVKTIIAQNWDVALMLITHDIGPEIRGGFSSRMGLPKPIPEFRQRKEGSELMNTAILGPAWERSSHEVQSPERILALLAIHSAIKPHSNGEDLKEIRQQLTANTSNKIIAEFCADFDKNYCLLANCITLVAVAVHNDLYKLQPGIPSVMARSPTPAEKKTDFIAEALNTMRKKLETPNAFIDMLSLGRRHIPEGLSDQTYGLKELEKDASAGEEPALRHLILAAFAGNGELVRRNAAKLIAFHKSQIEAMKRESADTEHKLQKEFAKQPLMDAPQSFSGLELSEMFEHDEYLKRFMAAGLMRPIHQNRFNTSLSNHSLLS